MIFREWPVREGLLAFVELLRKDALANYERQLDQFIAGGRKKKPPVPSILKGAD